MQYIILTSLFLLAAARLGAQDVSGNWTGKLSQEGVNGVFEYSLALSQQGEALSGTATAHTPDGKHTARFTVAGKLRESRVTLQEIEQTEPAQPKWCLKYATLQLRYADGKMFLEGDWTAGGCRPGRMMLEKPAPARRSAEIPAYLGQWTGHLSQSDREYGFFYQIIIAPDATGESYIVSEGSGGSARHFLRWEMEPGGEAMRIREWEVTERTDPKWKWCIKSARLSLRREDMRLVMEGDWEGFIEGRDDASGACAPGSMFLERPILPDTVARQSEAQSDAYTTEQGRKVLVGNVIQVAKPEIRIKIWDNGVVDGDVATLFLNGKRILNRHKVNKHKYSLPVKLNAENNVLVLHAESLGSVPPNTVAVSVYDGVKEQVVVLCSNLQESGAVLIRTFRVE